MALFTAFQEDLLYNILENWRKCGIRFIRIICGPLEIAARVNMANLSLTRKIIEAGMTEVGSAEWFGQRYIAFRCIYGILRNKGFHDIEWDLSECYNLDNISFFLHTVRMYKNSLSIQVPDCMNHSLLIDNMLTTSYMKIFPVRSNNLARYFLALTETRSRTEDRSEKMTPSAELKEELYCSMLNLPDIPEAKTPATDIEEQIYWSALILADTPKQKNPTTKIEDQIDWSNLRLKQIGKEKMAWTKIEDEEMGSAVSLPSAQELGEDLGFVGNID